MAKTAKIYDVIVVGAGPAGIFCTLKLVKKGLKVLLLEKGKPLAQRFCPAPQTPCSMCASCSITSGWGGAGAFSDGKLTFSSQIGGWLNSFFSEKDLEKTIKEVVKTFIDFGAPAGRVFGDNLEAIEELKRKAIMAELVLLPTQIKHLGTENCSKVLQSMFNFLKDEVEILFNTEVKSLIVENGQAKGVVTNRGEFRGKTVVLAPGRTGADWLRKEATRLRFTLTQNNIDLGVRVEVPAPVLEPLTKTLYEAKLLYFSRPFEDRVRTFCMNPYGEVIREVYEDVITVNGHSFADKKSENTNFAILVSTNFTEPFKEPIAYGKYIARLANLLGEGIILQRLGDLIQGRRSTWERVERSVVKPSLQTVTPGDLSFALPYRYLADVLGMLRALDKLVPGVYSPHTLLYGVEVKFYSSRLKLNKNLETEVKNLFAAGDGAGITRGLAQAAASGILVARSILKRLRAV